MDELEQTHPDIPEDLQWLYMDGTPPPVPHNDPREVEYDHTIHLSEIPATTRALEAPTVFLDKARAGLKVRSPEGIRRGRICYWRP